MPDTSMWTHFVNLIHRSANSFFTSLGTNKLGWFIENVVLFLGTVAVTLVVVRIIRGRAAMTSHARENVLIGLIVYVIVSVGLWGLLFSRSLVQTTFYDHQLLAAKVVELRRENRQLLSASEVPQLQSQLKQAQADAQRWQDSYQRIASGELVPDRILNSQQTAALYDDLTRLAKDSRNRDFISVEIGAAPCGGEPSHLAFQIYQSFRNAHWSVKFRPVLGDSLQSSYNSRFLTGITIWSDQPNNKGIFITSALKDAGLAATVNPVPLPQGFRGTLIWIEPKQFYPVDMK